jgi:hypothetical protein
MWWFDFWARWYDDEEHMDEVATCLQLGNRVVHKPLESVAGVLLVVDAESMACQGWRSLLGPCLSRLVIQLGHTGTPVDIIETGDLEKSLSDRHRLVIFPNLWKAGKEKRAKIRELLDGSERTVLWLYAPSAVADVENEEGIETADRCEDLTGFRVWPTDEEAAWPGLGLVAAPVESSGIPFVDRWFTRLGKQRLEGESTPEEISSEAKMTPLLCHPVEAETGGGVLLARTADGKPGLLVRRMDGRTSVWCASPMLMAPWLRAIAAAAGVHFFIDGEDAVYANSDLLCIAATPEAGPRDVRLKEPRTVRDFRTGKVVSEASDRFTIDLQAKEVVILELEGMSE